MSESRDIRPVLILGAGVNGCAVARELVLNNLPVVLVDTADIATGATAKSSRLIHGGLRYLEYADFHLVGESLRERERQLKLAPQFVKPLRLHIPIRRRLGGLIQSAFRFSGLTRFSLGRKLAADLSPWTERGLYTVRFGLCLYDWLARSSLLPDHSVHRLGEAQAPRVDPQRFNWVCSYSDAQMVYPERFVIALLKDADQHAREHGIDFRVLTYHEAELENARVRIHQLDRNGQRTEAIAAEFSPATIVNATGAWGDLTLKTLGVAADRLFGGTKGSHIITRHAGLRSAIGDDGIYAETSDGRLVFILPFGEGTLVGTTDLRFEGSPGEVVASEEEIAYLLEMVNSVMEGIHLQRTDVVAHYCGVRPLPYVPSGKTGSIPRGHSCHTSEWGGIPLHTLIGGKLTTWRAFGEEMADRILGDVQRPRITHTGERLIPGAYTQDFDISSWIESTARETGQSPDSVRFLFELMGTGARDYLDSAADGSQTICELPLAPATIRRIIDCEWVTRLTDLVERRLALVFRGDLSLGTLNSLADCLVECGRLPSADRNDEVRRCLDELHRNYGITVINDNSG